MFPDSCQPVKDVATPAPESCQTGGVFTFTFTVLTYNDFKLVLFLKCIAVPVVIIVIYSAAGVACLLVLNTPHANWLCSKTRFECIF